MAIHRIVMPPDLAVARRERAREHRRMHREPPPRTVRGSHLNTVRRLLGLPPVWFVADAIPPRHGRPPGDAGDGPAGTREPRWPRGPRPALSVALDPPEDPRGDVDAVGRNEPRP